MSDRRASPRVSRRLAVAGAAAGGVLGSVVLIAAVLGGDGPQDASGLVPQSASSVVPTAQSSSAPTTLPPPPAASGGRDPFVQVVPSPRSGPPGGAPRPPGATATSSAPVTSATTVPSAAPAAGADAVLELRSIGQDAAGVTRANLTVDGQPANPAEGDVFTYGFRLERIDGNCVEVSAQTARARMCLPAAKP